MFQADVAWADEAKLLARLRGNDPDGFADLVRRFGDRLHAAARRFFRCEQDRDDAVQEAFLSAFQSIGLFRGQSGLGTWLHRILVNVCLMRLRARSRRPEVHLADPLPGRAETAEAAAGQAEACELVRRCIDRLPEDYRRVVLLRDVEERSTEETATLLATSRGAVKTRLHRARQALRALLEPLSPPRPTAFRR
jgi:RNA polymerase sigma-70 factor (ECF subfamily)